MQDNDKERPFSADDIHGAAASAPAPDPAPLEPNMTARELESSGRHPVLIFGSKRAGKSTLLMSLFQCARRMSISIELGAPIGPPDSIKTVEDHRIAEDLFNRKAHEFSLGRPIPGTDSLRPFFVPIDIWPARESAPLKFAFLEGRGEWYMPNSIGQLYQNLQEDIVDTLRHYSSGLSVIYVAPYSAGGGSVTDTVEADAGLAGAISQYRAARELFRRDHHLYLLNKWDEYARPQADSPMFSQVGADQVEAVLNERYRASWPAYKGIPLSPGNRQRFFMQYAAANIIGDVVRDPPERHRPAFDRYPKILWNWLFENAIRSGEGRYGSHSRRRSPFPDALPPSGIEVRVERLHSLIGLR